LLSLSLSLSLIVPLRYLLSPYKVNADSISLPEALRETPEISFFEKLSIFQNFNFERAVLALSVLTFFLFAKKSRLAALGGPAGFFYIFSLGGVCHG
jgi:hypothetical protein